MLVWDLCVPSSESTLRARGLGTDVFSCGCFPNSWVWTWRNWRKSKRMPGWETEAWAAWQVTRGEGSPVLAPRVAREEGHGVYLPREHVTSSSQPPKGSLLCVTSCTWGCLPQQGLNHTRPASRRCLGA